LAISGSVTGPYIPAKQYDSATYATSTVVRYSFSTDTATPCYNTGAGGWNKGFGAIDPSIVYDDSGNMWMNYGSWKGGIAIMRLNNSTGMPDTAPADTSKTASDYGTKIASGSGGPAYEGACVVNFKSSDYYYLFNSCGNVNPDYSVRVSRCPKSEGITGAYKDSNGIAMNSATWNSFHGTGNKILGSFQFGSECGWRAPGGQSILVDGDKIFLASHTRTNFHETWYFYLQIRQLYFTTDGWPVLNPNEYGGESLRDIAASELAGTYDAVLSLRDNIYGSFTDYNGEVHDKVNVTDANETASKSMVFGADGSISGNYSGSWSVSGHNIAINLKSASGNSLGSYLGVVTDAYDSARKGSSVERKTLCFTSFCASTGEYFFGNLHNF